MTPVAGVIVLGCGNISDIVKKRLILDLTFLNAYIKKEHVKFEDWKVALDYFRKNIFCVQFDLHSGYHHIDISPKSQTYLGVSWLEKFYCFTVLPLVLAQRRMRPILKYSERISLILFCI